MPLAIITLCWNHAWNYGHFQFIVSHQSKLYFFKNCKPLILTAQYLFIVTLVNAQKKTRLWKGTKILRTVLPPGSRGWGQNYTVGGKAETETFRFIYLHSALWITYAYFCILNYILKCFKTALEKQTISSPAGLIYLMESISSSGRCDLWLFFSFISLDLVEYYCLPIPSRGSCFLKLV